MTDKDKNHDDKMLCDGLQMDQPTIHSPGQRTDEDAYMPALRNMQDSDGVSDWLAVQWAILRDAGLLNE